MGKRKGFEYQDMLQDNTFYMLYICFVVLNGSQIPRYLQWLKYFFLLTF